MYKAVLIAAAWLFFMVAGWKISVAMRTHGWMDIGLAMFIASMGNALIQMCARERDRSGGEAGSSERSEENGTHEEPGAARHSPNN